MLVRKSRRTIRREVPTELRRTATSQIRQCPFAQVVTVQERPGSSPNTHYRSTGWLCVAPVSPGSGRIGPFARLVSLQSRGARPDGLLGLDPRAGPELAGGHRVTVESQRDMERWALRGPGPGPRGLSGPSRSCQRIV